MNSKPPEEVIKRAESCNFSLSCLETGKCGDYDLCEVSDVNGENMLFLKKCGWQQCSYRLKLAGEYICRCPVHYWLERSRR